MSPRSVVGGRHLVSWKAASLRGGRSPSGAWAWRVCAVRISHPAVASTGDNGCPERCWKGATHQSTVCPRSGTDPAGASPPGLVLLDTSSRGARTAARECARESLKRRLQKSSGDAWRWTSRSARAHPGEPPPSESESWSEERRDRRARVTERCVRARSEGPPGSSAMEGVSGSGKPSSHHGCSGGTDSRSSQQARVTSPDHWNGDEASEARSSGRRAEENAALRVGERKKHRPSQNQSEGPAEAGRSTVRQWPVHREQEARPPKRTGNHRDAGARL